MRAPTIRNAAWGVFALALGLRLIHLWQLGGSPFAGVLLGDAAGYDAWAREIAGGNVFGNEVFYQAPLYPYLLALVYALSGGSLAAARIAQAVLGACACVLLLGAGRRWFDDRVGVGAGLLLAVYAPAIFFDGLIQKSSLDLFLVCLLLWLLGGVARGVRPASWLKIGLALGALILNRENALLLIAPIGAWLALHHGTRPRLARHAGAFALGLLVVLAPVALRNQWVGGELHLTTSQLGTNLYIGNNPAANGSYTALRPGRGSPRYERIDATELAEAALGRELTPGEVSSYWTGRALDYIGGQPLDWLRLMGRKLRLLAGGLEPVDVEDQYTHADWSIVLRLTGLLFHWGLLAPLALVGALATLGRRSSLWPLYAIGLVYAASVLIFYVFARYRYPLVPLLVLFASAGLVGTVAAWRAGRRRQVAVWAVVALLAAVLCNVPVLSRGYMRATTLNNLGSAFLDRGDLDQAERFSSRALELVPDYPQAHYTLGVVAQSRGDLERAARAYARAVELDPAFAAAQTNLAAALLVRGDETRALEHAEAAVRLEPRLLSTLVTSARVLMAVGRRDEAIDRYRRALQVAPADAQAHYELGNALAQAGVADEAAMHFAAALAAQPTFAPALANQVRVLRGAGRIAEAVKVLEDAAARNPDWHVPLTGLGWILATHPDAAVRDATRATAAASRAVELTGRGNPRALDALAAAHAAAGRFDQAVAVAEEARRVAEGAGDTALAGRIGAREARYRRGEPFIDS